MSRFYVPKEAIHGNRLLIDGREAHHILDVMRLKKLDKIVAFDGSGKEYVGFIKDISRKSISVEIVETRTPLSRTTLKVALIQAIPKKEKMDYTVEKSTELGVHSIIPIVTKRTVPRWSEAKRHAHVERWRKIVKEASKQCGRTDVPRIEEVADFRDVVRKATDYDLALIAALSDEALRLKDVLRNFNGGKLAIAIGPEGDFTPEEIRAATAAGFRLVNLGPRVLKSDTAGLAVLAMLNYEISSR